MTSLRMFKIIKLRQKIRWNRVLIDVNNKSDQDK
jgi:hypothetical protein